MKVVLIIATAVLLQSGFGQETKLITISSGFDEPSDLDVISGGAVFGFLHVAEGGNPGGAIRPGERSSSFSFPQKLKFRIGGSVSITLDFFFDESLEHAVATPAIFYLDAKKGGISISLNLERRDDLENHYFLVSGGSGILEERRLLLDMETGWHRVEWTMDFVGGRFDDQINTVFALTRITDVGLTQIAYSKTAIFNHGFLNTNLDSTFKIRTAGNISGLALIDNISLTAPVMIDVPTALEDATPALAIKMYPGIQVVGKTGLLYTIESASSVDGEWKPIGAMALSKSPQLWIDEHPAPDRRFYRAVIQE